MSAVGKLMGILAIALGVWQGLQGDIQWAAIYVIAGVIMIALSGGGDGGE